MAFVAPTHRSVLQIISSLDHEQVPSRRVTNLPRKLTLMLKQTYSEILATKSFPSSFTKFSSSFPTDEMGYLLVGKSFPILLKRYRLAEVIALGTFSQIFRAMDLFCNQEVAVKVMRIGYSVLGVKEYALLQHMARKTLRGAQLYAKCLDSFVFEDHYCLVLELYDSTLFSLLKNVDQGVESSDNHKPSHISHNKDSGLTIVQPKVLRPVAGGKASTPSLDQRIYNSSTLAPSSSGMHGIVQQSVGINLRGMRNLKFVALKLASAMHLLRLEGIIHADIKPENCFLSTRGEHEPSSTIDAYNSGTTDTKHINSLDIDTLEVRLGDMGNSIHTSEIALYYAEFGIQSLPYRAPEVLLGLPFTAAIDMWSLGVLLVEICTGASLFVGRSREDMLAQISQKLAPLCPVTFSGGMYSHLLSEVHNSNLLVAPQSVHVHTNSSTREQRNYSIGSNPAMGVSYTSGGSSVPFAYSTHIKCIKRLLMRALPASSHSLISSYFLHFVGGLLMPDPKLRLTPIEALTHPFLCDTLCVPLQLLHPGGGDSKGVYDSRAGTVSSSSSTASGVRSSRSVTASIAQLRRLTASSLVPREIIKAKPPPAVSAPVGTIKREKGDVTKSNAYRQQEVQINDSRGKVDKAIEPQVKAETPASSSSSKRKADVIDAPSSTSSGGAGRGQTGNNSFMALFSPPAKHVNNNSNFARLQNTLQSSLQSAQQQSNGVHKRTKGGDSGAAEHKQPEDRKRSKGDDDDGAHHSGASKFSKYLY